MRKTITIIISLLFPIILFGQAQINTKKVKIADFTQKVTKVVMSGNDFIDGTLADEVVVRWRVSPYEFCSMEEFETLKSNDEYYFLIATSGKFRKETEPTLQFLTLVKGGAGAEKGISEMLEVISLPIASAKFPTGRELVFMPAFLDIIQDYTLASMENDRKAYGGLVNHTQSISKCSNPKIVFSEGDLCEAITETEKEFFFGEDMTLASEEEVDSYILDSSKHALVSYIVAPTEHLPGSYCYKMLIDTQNNKLYYYKKHKITKTNGAGFLVDDLKRIHSAHISR